MGLFSDYASTLGLNEGATYFNEAELREEMENLEAKPDYEFDENSDIEECCIQALMINEQNYANIMMNTAVEEMKQIVESGTDVVNEASLGDFFDKIKEMINKAWEKIKSIYNKCLATINSWISSDKRFVDKYSDTIKNADKKCFQFFGYDIIPNLSKNVIKTYESLERNMSEAFNVLTTGKNAIGGDVNASKASASNLMKDNIIGDGLSPEQYIHEFKKGVGLDKKAKITKLNASVVLSELKDGKENKKNIQEAYKSAKASVAAMKKDVDFLKKYAEKPTKTSKPNFGVASALCSKTLSLFQQIQRVSIKAQNTFHQNCRKAAARAVRGITDSANESFEGFDPDVNTSSNREFGFLV